MKVKEFAKELLSLKKELQESEIRIIATNGDIFIPEIKFQVKDKVNPLEISKENVEYVIISH